jgi:hypothetical protein
MVIILFSLTSFLKLNVLPVLYKVAGFIPAALYTDYGFTYQYC